MLKNIFIGVFKYSWLRNLWINHIFTAILLTSKFNSDLFSMINDEINMITCNFDWVIDEKCEH